MITMDESSVVLEGRIGFGFEEEGVLNPACIEKDGLIHMFYRAVGKGNFSTIGYCQLKDNKVVYRSDKPVLVPEYQYESQGVEDPRITYFEGKYYLFYTSFDGQNALVAYATSLDLKTFKKEGVITPQFTYDEAEDIFRNSGVDKKYVFFEKAFKKYRGEDVYLWEKDAMLFPRKINGRYAIIHRVLPGIQICYFDDFSEFTQDFWRKYLRNLNDFLILDPKYDFESSYIGGGCVPIETEDGWLLIYHAVSGSEKMKVYSACAALLDLKNPQKIIGRLPYPIFSPEKDWEKEGIVSNVVFPTGAIIKNGILSIYYGAADKKIAVRSIKIEKLLEELKK